MTREDKAQVIAELTDKLKENNHFYVTDTSGLTVGEINKFREMCYKEGVEYKKWGLEKSLFKKELF